MVDHNIFDILACPSCKGKVIYKKQEQEIICRPCGLAFPIKDGIPIMLAEQARSITTDERMQEK